LQSSSTTVNAGTLGGIGSVQSLTVASGTLRPGIGGFGALGATSATLGPASTLAISLNNQHPNALDAPKVAIQQAQFAVSLTFEPAVNEKFTFITGTITGNFNGLPEGSILPVRSQLGNRLLKITYTDPGDVIVIQLSLVASVVDNPVGPSVAGQNITFTVTLTPEGQGGNLNLSGYTYTQRAEVIVPGMTN